MVTNGNTTVSPSGIAKPAASQLGFFFQKPGNLVLTNNTSHEHLQWKTIDSQHLKQSIQNANVFLATWV
jgi:hypothetical protein